MNAMDILIYNVVNQHPNNWLELEKAALTLRDEYKGKVDKLRLSMQRFQYAGQGPHPYTIEGDEQRLCKAERLYYGAKAAAKQNVSGEFTTSDDIAARIGESMMAGYVLQSFIQNGRELSAYAVFASSPTAPNHTASEVDKGQRLFNGINALLELMDSYQYPVRPSSSTILNIIQDETGTIPMHLKRQIRDVIGLGLAAYAA